MFERFDDFGYCRGLVTFIKMNPALHANNIAAVYFSGNQAAAVTADGTDGKALYLAVRNNDFIFDIVGQRPQSATEDNQKAGSEVSQPVLYLPGKREV